MYRCYPNVLPVANKYVGHKIFLKEQADHKSHVRKAQSVLKLSEATPPSHLSLNTRRNKIKEHEQILIKQENERLRTRTKKVESIVDSRNTYAPHSLNAGKRQRDKTVHENELQRLRKRITQIRPSYPAKQFQKDYTKNLDAIRRLCNFPLKVK